jgi:NosR/NirI family transcriptional regulator, nitrous oxide reductase regulator
MKRLFRSWLVAALLIPVLGSLAHAAPSLEKFLNKVAAEDLMKGADRYGPIDGSPPIAGIFAGDKRIGYVFLNTDFNDATGYSGKPIHVLTAVDVKGTIAGLKLVKHSEPIVLIGIPEKRILEFMERYIGIKVADIVNRKDDARSVDMISGATVTVLVIEDSIFRAAVKMARRLGLGGLKPTRVTGPKEIRTVKTTRTARMDWETLLTEGAVRKRRLTVSEVNEAFEKSGNAEAIARHEEGEGSEPVIDLYMAPANVPAIGKSILGKAEYKLLIDRLKPGQSAMLIFANGRYSFKGSGYVRGGLFERIQIIQGENSHRFRDRDHKRLGEVLADGAPYFKEVGLFVFPKGTTFDPTAPWRLQLLMQRAIGPIKKTFVTFDTTYRLPDGFVNIERLAAPRAQAPEDAREEESRAQTALWQRIWRGKKVDIIILVAALTLLTGLFFFQNILVMHLKLTDAIRTGFLIFTVIYIGYYAQAQLSVVNVFTFSNSLLTGFRWEYFLMEPMIFILWCAVAASLLFWGRGAYCGWLCPFGALQELLNKVAKFLKVPQWHVPWGIHERAWPIKYMIFLALFGLSVYSLTFAEELSEVEPFKTAIVLKFMREAPFVLYAVALLGIGLFVERFFCRYLCPLGAALAIPGRLSMFVWLKRYKECGSPCQRCSDECMVQAIHPEGHINPNECLYCLNCQTLYFDDHRCPVMISKRERRERRAKLSAGQPIENQPNTQATSDGS